MIRTAPSAPDWLPPLAEGEELRWHGRPDTKAVWPVRHLVSACFGVLFALSALFYFGLCVAYQTLILAPPALAFGLMSLGFFGVPVWLYIRYRRGTRYALTTRQAITLRDGKIEHWPLTKDTELTDIPTGIHFAKERIPLRWGYRWVPVGFERIAGETHHVQALTRQIAAANLAEPALPKDT